MATLHSSEPTLQTLHHHFSPPQEMRLREEDLVAGRTVSSILIAVVGARNAGRSIGSRVDYALCPLNRGAGILVCHFWLKIWQTEMPVPR